MERAKIDLSLKASIAAFKGFLEVGEHQRLGNELLDMAVKNGYSKMIIDTSEMKVIPQESQQWIQTNWFPRANKAGIRYIAFLVPSDLFGKSSTKSVNERAGNIEIQYFESMTKARTWLASKD
jgi:hypothetical protein